MRPLALLGVLVLVVGIAAVALAPTGTRLVALDVGQGDGFLVESDGTRLLVDGGPDPVRTLRSLGEALPFAARRIDVLALTHAHSDHATGLAAIVDRYDVGLALEPVGLPDGALADAWHDALARRGVPLRAVRRGDRVRAGPVVIDVLAPFGDPRDELQNLALHVAAGPLSVVFLGDATERGQEDLLLRPDELDARVYVPPHHGAATPHAAALVAAAHPTVALLSVGAGNRYGHPTPETLRALAGVPVLRTDRDGTLEVSTDGTLLRCRTRATALARVWSGWLSRPPPCA